MPIFIAFLGLFAGLLLDRYGGWLYGALAGLALGHVWRLRQRLTQLEQKLARLRLATPTAAEDAAPLATPPPRSPHAPAAAAAAAENAPEEATEDIRNQAKKATADTWSEAKKPPIEPPTSDLEQRLQTLWQTARDWLLGGNLMVRVGVVLLFFGVAFLLKFAADNSILPIELRLAGVALGGILMLLLGWRLRGSKPLYGLALQGGAIGILYLTVFAALRLYALLPPSLAFSILLLFATFSALLALAQNAQSLAVLGAAGGFLAPVLTATGEGSHVQLFSYYLVLNLGIVSIAWFRAWRVLNLVGFVFTFVIAALWGVQYYQPVFFNSTEPFLVAFVLLYIAIAVLFAFRQPPHLRGYLDASLVFGVPLVGFALQTALVQGMDYYLAWSALAAGAFYIALASVLFVRLGKSSRLLAEAFLAIGVVFATLTVPLALDARWTAAMWALEGAAMAWVGRRQGHLAPRLFGYLLQIGAGLAFADAAQHHHAQLPLINGLFLGALIIAGAGLFTAWQIYRHAQASRWERLLHRPFFLWGLLWWYAAWLFEIFDQIDDESALPLSLGLFISASGLLADDLRRRVSWPALRHPARLLLPSLYLLLPFSALFLDHPFAEWAWLAWVAGLIGHGRVLAGEPNANGIVGLWHQAGLWLLMIVLSWETAWWLDNVIQGADTWWRTALGWVPAGLMLLLMRFAPRLPWPFSAYPELYQDKALRPVGFYLWGWVLVLCLASRGAADPLPYLPLLNPMDIAVGLVLLVLLHWLYPFHEQAQQRLWRFAHSAWAIALTLFIWLNTVWFRTAHHWLHIAFTEHAMLSSQTVQTGLAILWGSTGLGAMIAGHRLRRRHFWFVGAGLMAAVVLKLFLVDLSHTGTLARIVSFLSVGALLLIVGYFAPIPPRGDTARTSRSGVEKPSTQDS
jgi:uncharacterized membrane protein